MSCHGYYLGWMSGQRRALESGSPISRGEHSAGSSVRRCRTRVSRILDTEDGVQFSVEMLQIPDI